MEYRKAVSENIPELVDIRMEFLLEANGQAFENEELLRSEMNRYFIESIPDERFISWICIDNDKIIACSGISFYELAPMYSNPSGRVGYIMNMFTKKAYRHKGIAAALFEKMIEEGRKKKVGKFILHATDMGRSLYEKYGFVPTKDEMVLKVQ